MFTMYVTDKMVLTSICSRQYTHYTVHFPTYLGCSWLHGKLFKYYTHTELDLDNVIQMMFEYFSDSLQVSRGDGRKSALAFNFITHFSQTQTYKQFNNLIFIIHVVILSSQIFDASNFPLQNNIVLYIFCFYFYTPIKNTLVINAQRLLCV